MTRNVANFRPRPGPRPPRRRPRPSGWRQQAAIESELAVEQRQIESDRDVALANQEKAITVANKSREESKAEAEANTARAEAVRSEEQVKTVARVAEAERVKEVAIVAPRRTRRRARSA